MGVNPWHLLFLRRNPPFRKRMLGHHWHGPDFSPGESCCGCGM